MAESNEDITNLREQIEKVEAEIKQVKAALELHMAFTDEEKIKLKEQVGKYRFTDYWSYDKLQSRLSELTTNLTAKKKFLLLSEENLLLEEKRLERGFRELNDADVNFFTIKAEFDLADTSPRHWFLSLLARKLIDLKPGIVVFGSCDRNGLKISVDFLLESIRHRSIVVDIVSDLAKLQSEGGHLSTSFAEITHQLKKTIKVVVLVSDLDSIKEWEHVRKLWSPYQSFKRESRDFEAGDDELYAPFTKRQKSDDSGCISLSYVHNAPVLWAASETMIPNQTDIQIRKLITKYDLPCEDSIEAEMARLQKLTWRIPLQDYELYDELAFFFQWCFQKRGEDPSAGWNLYGDAVFINDFDHSSYPAMMLVKEIHDSEWLTWQRALALRKAITTITELGKISVIQLKAEWAGKTDDGKTLMESMGDWGYDVRRGST